MARRHARFTVTDVTRALKGAMAAGMEIARCEIDNDGRIIIVPKGGEATASDEPTWEAWDRRQAARRTRAAQATRPERNASQTAKDAHRQNEAIEKSRRMQEASVEYPFFANDDLAALLKRPMTKMERSALSGIVAAGPSGARAGSIRWAGPTVRRKLAARDLIVLDPRKGVDDWVAATAAGIAHNAEHPFEGSPRWDRS